MKLKSAMSHIMKRRIKEAMALQQEDASEEAAALGLVSTGFGRYAAADDPYKKTIAQSINGKLVKVEPQHSTAGTPNSTPDQFGQHSNFIHGDRGARGPNRMGGFDDPASRDAHDIANRNPDEDDYKHFGADR